MGLGQENSGIISVLAYTQPLFVFCLAVPFLKEKTTTMKLLGTATGFIGVTVLFAGRIGSFTINSVLVSLFGAFLWGASIVYCKKFLSEVDPYVTQFLALSVGTLLSIGLNLTGKSFFFPIDVNYMLIVVYCSIGGLAMGNVIWLYLLEREEATILSGSSLIVPAIALLLGWLILGETLSSESLVGVGVTLLGIYVMHARDGKESRHG
jgi:drug/metabolite transporter (DMT)-like permease